MGVYDFDLAFAFEALARAFAPGGQSADARRYLQQATDAGQLIEEEGDRQYFAAELATILVGRAQLRTLVSSHCENARISS